MASQETCIQAHPDTQWPSKAWDKLKVKQKCEKVEPLPSDTPIAPDKIRFICISDTHARIEAFPDRIPPGDVILHGGDITNIGLPGEVKKFNDFLGVLPHPVKIVIAGNHDLTFDDDLVNNRRDYLRKNFGISDVRFEGVIKDFGVASVKQLLTNCVYLEDSEIDICGIKLFGSPWQPEFCDWGFNLPRGEACLEKWNLIPDTTDILITHGPPVGHGDYCFDGQRAGCVELLTTIQQRVKPKYHLFGHIHEGYGVTTDGQTQFINASTCNLRYKAINPPVVFDYPIPEGHVKEELMNRKPVRLIRNNISE